MRKDLSVSCMNLRSLYIVSFVHVRVSSLYVENWVCKIEPFSNVSIDEAVSCVTVIVSVVLFVLGMV